MQGVKYVVLLGIFFLNLPCGLTVFYANLYTYVGSFFKFRLPSDRTDIAPEWILSMCFISFSAGCTLSGTLKVKLGLHGSVLIGVILMGMGYFLSYLSISHSIWATSLTFGVLGTFGMGLLEVLSFCFTSAWFPDNQGLAGSIVCASGCIGAILYNLIITMYINPRNKKTDVFVKEVTFFSQTEILDRVPMAFIILGSLTFAVQILGLLMTNHRLFRIGQKGDESQNKLNGQVNVPYVDNADSESSSSCNLDKAKDDKLPQHPEGANGRNGPNKPEEISLENQQDKSPKEVLQSLTFYVLFLALMVVTLAMSVVSNYYKLFAQVWIHDDMFLANVGNSTALTSAATRMLMGKLIDNFKIKTNFIASLTVLTICLSFWYFTPMVDRWLYFAITNIVSAVANAMYVLIPLASVKFFGHSHFATNTGLIMLAMAILQLIAAPMMASILSNLGFFWLFFITSVLITCTSVVIILLLPRAQLVP